LLKCNPFLRLIRTAVASTHIAMFARGVPRMMSRSAAPAMSARLPSFTAQGQFVFRAAFATPGLVPVVATRSFITATPAALANVAAGSGAVTPPGGSGPTGATLSVLGELSVDDSEELRRARLHGQATGESSPAVADSVAAPTNLTSPVNPAASTASSDEGVRGLSTVSNISDSDRELIRRALREDPLDAAPAASETADGVKKRMGGVGHGVKGGDMMTVFTCNVCQTRTAKRFTKHAYTKGVVLVQCPGCGNKHLLADHLGWFADGHNTIEDILRAKGEEVTRLGGSIYLDDIKS
jgi:hypothetical protein